MQSKLLELQQPPIIGYLHHAYPLSILANDPEQFYPWFYSNYIQLYCHRNFSESKVPFNFYIYDFPHIGEDKLLKFYTYDVMHHFHSIPFLSTQRISRDLFIKTSNNLVEFLIHSINLGNYVFTYVDEYYVPDRKAFQNYNQPHDILIYGYDKFDQCFNIMGFSKDGKYASSKIKFTDLQKAYENIDSFEYPDFRKFIYLLKRRTDISFEFDLNFVYELITDYISSTNTSNRFSMFQKPLDVAFGIETYEYLVKYFKLLKEGKVTFDIRPIHILWEHKKYMLLRIKYIMDQGIIINLNSTYDSYREIEKEVENLRILSMKYNLTLNKKIIDTIIQKLELIKLKESDILESFAKIIRLKFQ